MGLLSCHGDDLVVITSSGIEISIICDLNINFDYKLLDQRFSKYENGLFGRVGVEMQKKPLTLVIKRRSPVTFVCV